MFPTKHHIERHSAEKSRIPKGNPFSGKSCKKDLPHQRQVLVWF